MVDSGIGFTSDIIRDPKRFVGRTDVILDCIRALNSPMGLIAVYGKRGIGKSSLLRQIQQMALGDYTLAESAGLRHMIPKRPRTYLTVYYTCDAMSKNGLELAARLCNDQQEEDGLLRLVPNDGKELAEFTRSKEVSGGADLKVIHWGAKGVESSKYARVVDGDVIQTFRNFVSAIVTHQVKKAMKRDALLILLDEFDVLQEKEGLGSLIKSLSSDTVKFGICGIGRDLTDLVTDHASVERLLEEGAIHVRPMPPDESKAIIFKAEELFEGKMSFDPEVTNKIAELSEGYPYLVQLFGKACVEAANRLGRDHVDHGIFDGVLNDIRTGTAFPSLESAYQKAIGQSEARQILLHLFAEQPENQTLFNDEIGRVVLKTIRAQAPGFEIEHVDQLIPRLVEKKSGPVLTRVDERGVYEFVNPVFRVYVKLRRL